MSRTNRQTPRWRRGVGACSVLPSTVGEALVMRFPRPGLFPTNYRWDEDEERRRGTNGPVPAATVVGKFQDDRKSDHPRLSDE
jgi:hypothetical protein